MNIEEAITIWEKLGYTVTPARLVEVLGPGLGEPIEGQLWRPDEVIEYWTVTDNVTGAIEEGSSYELIDNAAGAAQVQGWSTQPDGWLVSRDGAYPYEEWDPNWGTYPMVLNTSLEVVRADHAEANRMIDRRRKGEGAAFFTDHRKVADDEAARLTEASGDVDIWVAKPLPGRGWTVEESEDIPRPEGQPRMKVLEGWDHWYNPKTGEWDLRGSRAQPDDPPYEGYGPPGTPGQVIPPGWQLAPAGINRDTGKTIWTLERMPEQEGPRTLDELLFQSIQTGQPLTAAQIDGIIYVDKIRDWLDRRTITPEEAFNLAAPLMENPQHLSEMMTALLSETGQDIPFPEFNAGMSANAPLTKDSTGPGSDEVAVQQPNTLADALARPSDTAVFGDPISSPGDTAPVEGGILSQYEQDIQTYTADIRLNPQDPWAYYNRGVTHYNQGQYERAIQDYGEAIRLNPEFDWAKRNRDFAYDRLEEQDAKDVDPLTGDAGGVNTLAATLASQGDPLLSLSGDTGTSNWGENRVVSIGSPDPTLAAVQAAMAAPEFASLTEDQQIAAIRIAVAGSRYPGVDPIDAYVMGERDGTNPSRAEIIRLAHQSRAASQGRPAPTFPGDRGVNALAPAGVAAFNALTGRAQQGVQVDPESDRYKAMPEAANYAEELKKQQGRPYVTATGEYGGGTQYVPTSPIGAAGTPALGFGGQLPAYGGTPFYPITPGQSPQGTFQALGVRGWNKRQQELFKERGPQRKVFG